MAMAVPYLSNFQWTVDALNPEWRYHQKSHRESKYQLYAQKTTLAILLEAELTSWLMTTIADLRVSISEIF